MSGPAQHNKSGIVSRAYTASPHTYQSQNSHNSGTVSACDRSYSCVHSAIVEYTIYFVITRED